jgi:hypothetical protein
MNHPVPRTLSQNNGGVRKASPVTIGGRGQSAFFNQCNQTSLGALAFIGKTPFRIPLNSPMILQLFLHFPLFYLFIGIVMSWSTPRYQCLWSVQTKVLHHNADEHVEQRKMEKSLLSHKTVE